MVCKVVCLSYKPDVVVHNYTCPSAWMVEAEYSHAALQLGEHSTVEVLVQAQPVISQAVLSLRQTDGKFKGCLARVTSLPASN